MLVRMPVRILPGSEPVGQATRAFTAPPAAHLSPAPIP